MSKNQYVSWKSITPIIGDVVVSPWNILIGGLLIQYISFKASLISIILGYSILGLIFYFYGSLGFKYRNKTSELIEPIFGEKGTKYLFSSILAFGQIGWFAIITFIGGESLGQLLNIGTFAGVIIYAFIMFLMAIMKLHDMGIVKLAITVSSLGLIVYLVSTHFASINFTELWSSSNNSKSLIWGISIVLSSLISFSAVTPDFFSQVKNKKDITKTTILGLVIPGVIITSLGSVFFFNIDKLSFELLIGAVSLSFIGYIFNILTNTDASIAVLTPGNRINYMFKIDFKVAVAIATITGTILALLGITENLETWLLALAGIYPSIIIITLAYYYLLKEKKLNKSIQNLNVLIVILLGLLTFFIDSTYLIWSVIIGSLLYSIVMIHINKNIEAKRKKR